MMKWSIVLYNRDAACGARAEGRTKNAAFRKALALAGEPFLREGGDKLTTFRMLFAEYIANNRGFARIYTCERRNCYIICTRLHDPALS